MEMDEELAKEIIQLSQEANTTPQNMLQSLVWLGKKFMGRTVTVQSNDESRVLKVTGFGNFPKTTPLDKD